MESIRSCPKGLCQRKELPSKPWLAATPWAILALLTSAFFSPSHAQPKDLDAAIRKVRMGTLQIETSPGAEVRVEQVRHEFWFGAALANQFFGRGSDSPEATRYKEMFLTNFNAAVTENALKWHDMEREQGQVNYRVVDSMLAWTDQNGIPLRGHNIYWGIPNRVQPWLKSMDDETLRSALKARALDIGKKYKGRFAEYDLNNEMIHGNYYADRLGQGITKDMVSWVREADPTAVLYLNDYDILTGRRLADYMTHIRGFLAQGIPFQGIGVQGHLHGDSFDPAVLQDSLDQLAEFKLPIRVTEFNFPGQRSKYYENRNARLSEEEEQAKAKAIREYYRICFAHPAVEGILMWGFWEGANWIPVSSLYRRDWSPTPAAEAYRDLVFREWWTTWSGKANAQGRCEMPAFYGRHRVKIGSQETLVDLKRSAGTYRVSLRASSASTTNAATCVRALVLSEPGGQHSPFVAAAKRWLTDFGAGNRFEFDYLQNTKPITAASLANYGLFVQLDYPPYSWTPEAMSALREYIEKGKGGWVGFHHATLLGEFDGYPMWPWFSEFTGGIRFKNYIASFAAGAVKVEDSQHPCMRGLGASFPIAKEEWYTYDRSPRPNVRVLASVDEKSYSPPSSITMGDHPVVWTNEKMAARNVYIFMGHGPDLLQNPEYKTLLHNSFLWAAGREAL